LIGYGAEIGERSSAKVRILRPFQKSQIRPYPTNGSEVMITESWGCQFWTDEMVWTILDFKPLPKEFRENSEYQNPREFYNLSNS
jgi:hypothetical protein